MKKLSTLLAGAALALFVSSAFADDLFPPDWRGEDKSTLQQWEFLSQRPVAPADLQVNPYGNPYALIVGHDWLPLDGPSGRVGIWPLSGVMAFYVPNAPPNDIKYVWIQLTWRPTADPGVVPAVGMVVDSGQVCGLNLQRTEPLPDDWFQSVYADCIQPNPEFEVIGVGGDIDVDQVVIDTWCIPEPQTYGLLAGLGLLGFGVWRRLHS
jgi:hypothetical protein